MANSPSSKKSARKIVKRTEVNKARRSKMRTFVRKVEEAIASGDKSAAQNALREAQSVVARAGQKGIVHANTAARKISRLTARVTAVKA